MDEKLTVGKIEFGKSLPKNASKIPMPPVKEPKYDSYNAVVGGSYITYKTKEELEAFIEGYHHAMKLAGWE